MTRADAENMLALVKLHTICGLAKRTGRPRQTVQHWRNKALAMLGPDYEAGLPTDDPVAFEGVAALVVPTEKPRYRVRAGSSKYDYAGRPFSVVLFSDAHNMPGMALDRFEWLGRLVNEVKPQALVDLGDFDDVNSLCAHERNDTWKGRFKPAFQEDLAASEAARKLLHETITHKCDKYAVRGNHEDRIPTFENANPETYGTYSAAYDDITARYQWHVTPYRGWLNLHGVDMTHIVQNGMNRPAGGARLCVSIANKVIRDTCVGHSHLYGFHSEQKYGPEPGRSVNVLNTGTFTPQDYVAGYAKGSAKQSWHGCFVLEVESGRIASHEPITMKQLESRYS
jgi:hypothetical protein